MQNVDMGVDVRDNKEICESVQLCLGIGVHMSSLDIQYPHERHSSKFNQLKLKP